MSPGLVYLIKKVNIQKEVDLAMFQKLSWFLCVPWKLKTSLGILKQDQIGLKALLAHVSAVIHLIGHFLKFNQQTFVEQLDARYWAGN